MKKHLLFLFIAALTAAASLFPQEAPKPIYQIEVKRNGVSFGSFQIELFPAIAPKAVRYFDSLVAIKFYDTTAFHRVVPGFVIQGGDPNSKHLPRSTWGNGDPSQTNVPAEFNNVPYLRGVLGAARDTDPNSANSQFFICVANATSLNGLYTAYGRVISGMNIVDTIVAAPRDANDNPFTKIDMFITKIGTNDSVPKTPAAISPADNAIRISTDSSLTWSEMSDAMVYRLQIATDSNFSSIIYDKEPGTTSYLLNTVKPGLFKYYWRVASNNGGFRSPFTPYRSFTTALAVTKLVSPLNFSSSHPGNVTLKWNSVFNAVSYKLQVATSNQFTAGTIVFEQSGITDTVKQMSGLQQSVRHYWRVAAQTPAYEGIAYSPFWNFMTGTSAGVESDENIPSEYSLEQNYPNPFNPSTVIGFGIPKEGMVTLKIYDILGQEVAELVKGHKSAGKYSVEFNSGALSSGMYIYKLTSGTFSETRKMILMK